MMRTRSERVALMRPAFERMYQMSELGGWDDLEALPRREAAFMTPPCSPKGAS
jgi:hypothetical protein